MFQIGVYPSCVLQNPRSRFAGPNFISGLIELLRLDKHLICRSPCIIFQSLIEAVCPIRATGDVADLLNTVADWFTVESDP